VGPASQFAYSPNSDSISSIGAAESVFTTVSATSVELITKTIALTETRAGLINTSEAISSTSTASGLYYFSVENGTTTWLGGATPPPAQSYVIQTSTFVLQPVQSISPDLPATEQIHSTSTTTVEVTSFLTVLTETITLPSKPSADSTSTTTVEVTSFSTVFLTETITESTPSATSAPTVSGFAGVGAGSYGWNATTLHHGKSTKGWSGTLGYSIYATAASSVRPPQPTRPHPETAPISPRHHANRLNARQVGAIVTATINGVVVTWTNAWAGVEPSSTPLPVSFSPSLPAATISGKLKSKCFLDVCCTISNGVFRKHSVGLFEPERCSGLTWTTGIPTYQFLNSKLPDSNNRLGCHSTHCLVHCCLINSFRHICFR